MIFKSSDNQTLTTTTERQTKEDLHNVTANTQTRVSQTIQQSSRSNQETDRDETLNISKNDDSDIESLRSIRRDVRSICR